MNTPFFKNSLLILAIFILYGCSTGTHIFNYDTQKKYSIYRFNDLRNLQFYLNGPITIANNEKSEKTDQSFDKDGTVYTNKNKYIIRKEIQIPASTPGVCVNYSANKMIEIDFGSGVILTFHPVDAIYSEHQDDVPSYWFVDYDQKILIDGILYYISETSGDRRPYLRFSGNITSKTIVEREKKRISGKKVNE